MPWLRWTPSRRTTSSPGWPPSPAPSGPSAPTCAVAGVSAVRSTTRSGTGGAAGACRRRTDVSSGSSQVASSETAVGTVRVTSMTAFARPTGGTVSGSPTAGSTAPEARLLVVDDEPNIRELLSASLRYAGFEVETASDGQQALAMAESFRPDLLLLDVMMPGLDGFGVVRRLRQSGRHTPVLFLTARRRRRRQGLGPHARRRRLRHQAVQPRRGARAHPGRPAPERRRAQGRRLPPAVLRRHRARRGD